MALADKKYKKIFEKVNTNDKYFISSDKQTEISTSYAAASHLNNVHWIEDETNQAVLFQLQLIEEELDELRRFSTGSDGINVDGGSF